MRARLAAHGLEEEVEDIARRSNIDLDTAFRMDGHRRTPRPRVRAEIAHLLKLRGFTWPRIAELFEQDHSTILVACRKYAADILPVGEKELRKQLEEANRMIARLRRMLDDIRRLASNA